MVCARTTLLGYWRTLFNHGRTNLEAARTGRMPSVNAAKRARWMKLGRSAASEPPNLGTLEAQVMDVLWDHGPATVRNIIDRLPGDLAYTTIATVLANLGRKGFTTSHKENRSTWYQARIAREEHVASLMNHALGTSRDRAASILHFVDTVPESDLDLLREYLQGRDGDS